jgi:hypothetical protein
MDTYVSYLVRLWQTNGGDRPTWHASLEDPLTGLRQGFANPEAAFEYLKTRIQPTPQTTANQIADEDEW